MKEEGGKFEPTVRDNSVVQVFRARTRARARFNVAMVALSLTFLTEGPKLSAMKYTDLASFERHVQACTLEQLAPAYMVLSKEDFDREQATECLLSHLLKGEPKRDLAYTTFDGETTPFETIISELNTIPFLTRRKVILVRRFDRIKKNKGFDTYLQSPNTRVTLILSGESLAANTTLYKQAEKAGVILAIAEKKSWEKEAAAAAWLQQEAQHEGKNLPQAVAKALVKHSGVDQAVLRQELIKVICYIDERETITLEDVSALCTRINTDTIWQLSEAIFRRQAATAFRIGQALLDEGTALLALLYSLRTQFHTEFHVYSLLTKGGPDQVSQEFPYMRGKILQNHIEMAQGYGAERLRRGLLVIDDTELRAKNSGADSQLLLDRLLAKLVV